MTLTNAQDRELIAFGRAVRRLRDERNLSAGELAAAAGLAPGRLAAIEAGRLDPHYDVLLALAPWTRRQARRAREARRR